MKKMRVAVLTALMCAAGAALAHGSAGHGSHPPSGAPPEQKPWGIAGQPSAVRRTIEIRMTDDMRFSPSRITVKRGETVRFVVRNRGRMLHEMVIGTRGELDAHAALMARFPDMEHEEPYMTHVAPGHSGEIVWTFNRPGEFEFACLIPGHYPAGMVGRIRVSGN